MNKQIAASNFSNDFIWGIATSAPQIEGAYLTDGKGLSIWDTFSRRNAAIKDKTNLSEGSHFYHRFRDDLFITKSLGFKVFRFSISWCRILPNGYGEINQKGIQFYHDLIDACLQLDLVPYVTLYHWDLPNILQQEGGWASHNIIKWFANFVEICCTEFGDKVKNWMVLNEPLSFTGLGYMLGIHAPGKKGTQHFFPAVFNATLAQAEGAKIIRSIVKNANIGTCFSCSEINPYNPNNEQDIKAASKLNILINRLFIEPSLGLGFPSDDFEFIEKLNYYNKAWRYYKKMEFDFDFVGIQNYFPITVKHSSLIPIINAIEVKPKKRKVPFTQLGWEINPTSFYNIIHQFAKYEKVKNIIVTENGACFKDVLKNGIIDDSQRIEYFNSHLNSLLKAKNEIPKLRGYFAWTLLDNFEWAEGYTARFGIVHVDFKSQFRTIKNSGYWWRYFLSN